MLRKKVITSLATVSLGIAAYTSLNAATVLPGLPAQADKGVVSFYTQAKQSFFDYFEEGRVRHDRLHSVNPAAMNAPYALLTSKKESFDSLGMVLASLGLMAVIVHRRRNI